MPENYLGSCLCARVGYRLLSPPRAVTHCHCGQCRKSHGSAFASYGAVPRKDLCIVSGQSDIKSYASSASVHRQFCQHCGSSLFWSRQAGDWADWICIALARWTRLFRRSSKSMRIWSRSLCGQALPVAACAMNEGRLSPSGCCTGLVQGDVDAFTPP